MTLTFELAARFLFAACHFVMMIISAQLFSNPTMHDKVMGWTQTAATETYA